MKVEYQFDPCKAFIHTSTLAAKVVFAVPVTALPAAAWHLKAMQDTGEHNTFLLGFLILMVVLMGKNSILY